MRKPQPHVTTSGRPTASGAPRSCALIVVPRTATPNDKHNHARSRRPEEAAGSGGHCDQPRRLLCLAIAFNLGYPFPKLHLGSAQYSQRLAAWLPRISFATGHGQSEAAQHETSREGVPSRACRADGELRPRRQPRPDLRARYGAPVLYTAALKS